MVARVSRPRRSRLGATLAEGVVSVVISTIFLSVLPVFYQTSVRIWQRETTELAATHSADFALKRMEEDVRNARSAAVSSDGLTVTLTLPLKAWDSELGREVNVLSNGYLVDGDQVQYYFAYEASATSASYHGAICRRVVGSGTDPSVIVDGIQPAINPLDPVTTVSIPVFAYDPYERTLTVTVTAAQPRPSSGTFAPKHTLLTCTRDGGQLYRVPTEEHPEGELRCSTCGEELEASAEIVIYHTQFLVRNQ